MTNRTGVVYTRNKTQDVTDHIDTFMLTEKKMKECDGSYGCHLCQKQNTRHDELYGFHLCWKTKRKDVMDHIGVVYVGKENEGMRRIV